MPPFEGSFFFGAPLRSLASMKPRFFASSARSFQCPFARKFLPETHPTNRNSSSARIRVHDESTRAPPAGRGLRAELAELESRSRSTWVDLDLAGTRVRAQRHDLSRYCRHPIDFCTFPIRNKELHPYRRLQLDLAAPPVPLLENYCSSVEELTLQAAAEPGYGQHLFDGVLRRTLTSHSSVAKSLTSSVKQVCTSQKV